MHKRDKRNNQYMDDNSNEINASSVIILTMTLLFNLFCILWWSSRVFKFLIICLTFPM